MKEWCKINYRGFLICALARSPLLLRGRRRLRISLLFRWLSRWLSSTRFLLVETPRQLPDSMRHGRECSRPSSGKTWQAAQVGWTLTSLDRSIPPLGLGYRYLQIHVCQVRRKRNLSLGVGLCDINRARRVVRRERYRML